MWSEIDLGVIDAMMLHWQQEPPESIAAAALAGFKPPRRQGETTGADKVRELFSMFPSGVIRAG